MLSRAASPVPRLLDQHAHRQTVDQPSRGCLRIPVTLVQPGENCGRRLARARRYGDQTAFNWGRGKSFLIRIRGMSGSSFKNRFKVAPQPRHHRQRVSRKAPVSTRTGRGTAARSAAQLANRKTKRRTSRPRGDALGDRECRPKLSKCRVCLVSSLERPPTDSLAEHTCQRT